MTLKLVKNPRPTECLHARYCRLIKEHNELDKALELCNNKWDHDVIENIQPRIAYLREEIPRLEKELVKQGHSIKEE